MSKNPRLNTTELHTQFLNALNGQVISHSQIGIKPLDVKLRLPFPPKIRLYMYNATHPPGGRTLGEHKVQLIVPGQKRGMRASFDHSPGHIVILVGYQSELEIFILWDAGMYPEFSYSRNVQVNPETIYEAYAGMISEQRRRIRRMGTEIVIASDDKRLREALLRRIKYNEKRLLEE